MEDREGSVLENEILAWICVCVGVQCQSQENTAVTLGNGKAVSQLFKICLFPGILVLSSHVGKEKRQ